MSSGRVETAAVMEQGSPYGGRGTSCGGGARAGKGENVRGGSQGTGEGGRGRGEWGLQTVLTRLQEDTGIHGNGCTLVCLDTHQGPIKGIWAQ